jgi:AraC-like DNA-binding protein
MDKMKTPLHIPLKKGTGSCFTLQGTLKEYSTKDLHFHSCHQLLRMRKGITLLVEENRKQPLFSNMSAFIPAGHLHKSVVMGQEVVYKSIYLDEDGIVPKEKGIVIFNMSPLSIALFDRISLPSAREEEQQFHMKCLDLLLELLETEVTQKPCIARIPVPQNPETLKLTKFIEENFSRKLCLADFTGILHYSPRHISRLFQQDIRMGIFEYIKLFRIFSASVTLCREPRRTITDIGFSCGYESLSSFHKDFKQVFFMTPNQFRKQRHNVRFQAGE